MPLKILTIRPGVNTQYTPTLLQAGWSKSQLIRFRDGLLQKMGGWVKAAAASFVGICRGMHGWAQINGLLDMGIGTHLKLFLFQLGTFYDLTPMRLEGQNNNPFTTTNGQKSVNVNISNHGASVGDFFELGAVQYTIGGVTLTGEFTVTTVVDSNNFTITAPTTATSGATSGGIIASPTVTFAATAAAVSAGGSGYVNGDIIYLTGGTFQVPVALTVTGVSGGAVTTASILQAGFYTTTPSNPVSQSATSGVGTGATFNITFASSGATAASATPQAGGSGYAVNDTITLAGGTFTSATVLKVLTVSGSAVATVSVQTAGAYTVTPTNPVAQASSSGGGTGATFNVLWNVDVIWAFLLPVGLQDTQFVTGYGSGPYGSGPYGISGGSTFESLCRVWSIQNWGEFMLASPQNLGIYQWMPSSGVTVRATTLLNAPLFNEQVLVAIPQQQVVSLGAETGGSQDPMLVRWTDVGNNTVWTASATNQAGSYRIPRGSRIVGGIATPLVIVIWTNEGVWLMQYQGLPFVYGFTQIGFGCGMISQKAAAIGGTNTYWMSGYGNFYTIRGGIVQELPCSVIDKVIGNINPAQQNKVFAARDEAFHEIIWFYPSFNSTEIDSYVKYQYKENLWDFGVCAPFFIRTAWEDHDAFDFPLATDLNSFMFTHETGVDADGQPMDSFAQTGYMMLSEGEDLMMIERIIPDFATFAGDQFNITVLTIDFPNSDSASPVTSGPYMVVPGTTPYVICRARGRGAALKIDSNALGGNYRVGAIRARIAPAGKR